MKEFLFIKRWCGAGLALVVLLCAMVLIAPVMAMDASDAEPVAVSVIDGEPDCATEMRRPFPEFESISAHTGALPDCTQTADDFAPAVDSADLLEALIAGHNFWPGSMSDADRIGSESMATPGGYHWRSGSSSG